MNEAIVCYVEFVEEIIKSSEASCLCKSYQLFRTQYNQLLIDKVSFDIQNTLRASTRTIIYYSNIEQVWAYIHLLVECRENKKINILESNTWLQNMAFLQYGLSRIWEPDLYEKESYIYLET